MVTYVAKSILLIYHNSGCYKNLSILLKLKYTMRLFGNKDSILSEYCLATGLITVRIFLNKHKPL